MNIISYRFLKENDIQLYMILSQVSSHNCDRATADLTHSLFCETKLLFLVRGCNCVWAGNDLHRPCIVLSGNLIPRHRNTTYSWGRHGPVNAWFRSERPGNVILVPKTSTFFRGRNTLSIIMKLRVTGFVTQRKPLELRALCYPDWLAWPITPGLQGIKLSDDDSNFNTRL